VNWINLKVNVFWYVVLCILIEIDISEVLTASSIRIAMMMEAVSFSEMLVNLYETAQHNIPKDISYLPL
jgi:hypothetical protein